MSIGGASAIILNDIHKSFTDSSLGEVKAVDGVSFECREGEILGILGPNGAGKTTLLRILATILQPTSGSARVLGHDLAKESDLIKRLIGFLSGNTKLYRRLSAVETLAFFGRLYGMDEKIIVERSDSIFRMLNMEGIKDRRFEKLSTGEKQKVSIARCLIHDPPVLILDEPTAGLDVVSAKAIIDFVRQSKQTGKTVIVSTHYMTEAEELCDRVILISKGKIRASGTVPELLDESGVETLNEAFFHYLGNGEDA